jgi:O-antigen/teichoic acid export membrane protein
MSIRRRLVVGLAWMFAGSWAEQATNFIVFIILARLLGAEAFGLAAMSLVFVLLAEFLVRETMTETIIQLRELEAGHQDAVFWLLGAFSVVLVGLIIVLADQVAALFSEPQVAGYLIWATPAVLFIGFSGVPVANLRRNLEFRVLAIRATLGVMAGGIVGVSMALMDFGAWSLIGQRVTQVFVNNALAWIAYPWRPGFRVTRRHFDDVFSFSTKMVILRASELVAINSPTVVIGATLGPTALGLYTIAWRLVEILSFVLTTPIRFVAQPAFAHLNRNQGRAGELLRDVMNALSLITFASFLGMAAVGNPAVRYLLGEEWLPAVPVLQILCVLGIYLSIERMQQGFCVALGRAGRLIPLSIAEALLGIGAMMALSRYGLNGISAAFTLAFVLIWPLRIRLVTGFAELDVRGYLGMFVLPLILSGTMFIVVNAFERVLPSGLSPFSVLISLVSIGAVTYAALAWLTMRARLKNVYQSLNGMRKTVDNDGSSG